MQHTPIDESLPRVLVHVRGELDPPAARFWSALRHALRARGLELMLTAHYWTEEPADVPVLRVPSGLVSVRLPAPECGWSAWLPRAMPCDPAPYLERETLWNGPPENAEAADHRRQACAFFWNFYANALHIARPVITLIWNGHHPQEMILRDLCRQYGCPVHFIERAPVQGALQIDPEGILADTRIARSNEWSWQSDTEQRQWQGAADAVAGGIVEAGRTWWKQPKTHGPEKIRRRLSIASNQQVVLFAGQVDKDTQNLLFSPHFENTLSAFRWFCEQLPRDGSVFVLGKHHPKSATPPEAYANVLKGNGAWTTDVSIQDALAIADRAAAVNSTVLFEALMREKPALMLGQSLLSGKNIAYEVTDPQRDEGKVTAWLAAADFPARYNRWQDYLAYLLAHEFFSTLPPEARDGQRGEAELAGYIAAHATRIEETGFTRLTPIQGFIDEVALWDDCARRSREHEGVKEVLRGCNIIAKATLGRAWPRGYQRLQQGADDAFARSKGKRRNK